MAWSLISSVSKSDTTNGGTTSSIDTSGADFLICAIAYYTGTTTMSDSKSNSWTSLTEIAFGAIKVVFWYAKNATVGASHTFTIGGGTLYQCIMVSAWSGGHLTSPLDQQTGIGSFTNSRATGSITPTEDDELIVTALSMDNTPGGTVSVDSGVTKLFSLDLVTAMGGYFGYKIQTTAAAINPTWSWTTSRNVSAAVASFKKAAAVTGQPTIRRFGKTQYVANLNPIGGESVRIL